MNWEWTSIWVNPDGIKCDDFTPGGTTEVFDSWLEIIRAGAGGWVMVIDRPGYYSAYNQAGLRMQILICRKTKP
ncbi:MAG TPA: hypothetical protein VIV09_14620 [Pseudolabrys sp.]